MIDLSSLQNPFRVDVVQDAWQTPVDVESIHADVFQQCLRAIDAAQRGEPDSLVVHGAAGSGKTHLLARLQRHLIRTAPQDAADRVLRCVFVYVRLQTSAGLMWQHLRRRIANDLMRRDAGLTQLQRLIGHQKASLEKSKPTSGVLAVRTLAGADPEALSVELEELWKELSLPRDLHVVLEHLVLNRFVRDAASWLAGDSLPDAVLAEMGLGGEAVEDREEAARGVVTALGRLAGRTLPIVFCFDQVEALQRSPDDTASLFAFGRMAADLFDAERSVAIITCVQSGFLELFESSVRKADLDRMMRRRALLASFLRDQMELVVRARLALVPELASGAAPLSASSLYPLGAAFLASLPAPMVPRALLAHCARRYEQLQRGEAPRRRSVLEVLDAGFERRRSELMTGLRESETTAVLLSAADILQEITGVVHAQAPGEREALLVGDSVVASIRNEADGRSLRPRIRELTKPRKDGRRVVVVRDPRLPLPPAKQTRQDVEELRKRGASWVEPRPEAIAALAALSSLLKDAQAGDMSNEGESVEPRDVLAWLRATHGSAQLEPVRDLASSLVDPPAPAAALARALSDVLERDRAAEAARVALEVGRSVTEVLAVARSCPERFLVLGSEDPVILDVAGVTAEGGC